MKEICKNCVCYNDGWCEAFVVPKFSITKGCFGFIPKEPKEDSVVGVSYSPFCKYCCGVDTMQPGISKVFCGLDDSWHIVTTGNCFGHCDKQEVIDGTEPAKWIEPIWD